MSWAQSIRGYLRVLADRGPTQREFDRIGITDDVLLAHAAAIDAATPAFAQTRGKSWDTIGQASAAFLELLRRVPDNAGPEGLIAEFETAARLGHL